MPPCGPFVLPLAPLLVFVLLGGLPLALGCVDAALEEEFCVEGCEAPVGCVVVAPEIPYTKNKIVSCKMCIKILQFK